MIDTYDALCLQEPYLELILLKIKGLETRTKCLFRDKRDSVVLTSSRSYNEYAMNDPRSPSCMLDADARKRALAGLGKMRGIVNMSGFRPGLEGEDLAACIQIRLPDGSMRWVSAVTNVCRIVEVPTVRVRPKLDSKGNQIIVEGSMQGVFKVPRDKVVIP